MWDTPREPEIVSTRLSAFLICHYDYHPFADRQLRLRHSRRDLFQHVGVNIALGAAVTKRIRVPSGQRRAFRRDRFLRDRVGTQARYTG